MLPNDNSGHAYMDMVGYKFSFFEKGKLQFNISVEQWMKEAIDDYGITVMPLDIPIIVESTRLPGKFHKDPADQLIVASARVHDIQLLTADEKILKYPFVKLLK